MIQLSNKFKPSEGYSGNVFDLEYATINGVVYAALDPTIFEIKLKQNDLYFSIYSTYWSDCICSRTRSLLGSQKCWSRS